MTNMITTCKNCLKKQTCDDYCSTNHVCCEWEGEQKDVLEYLVMNFSLEDLKKAVKIKNSICFVKK